MNRDELRERIAAHAGDWRDPIDLRFSTRGVLVAFLGNYDHEALGEVLETCHGDCVGVVQVKMITKAVKTGD